MEPRTDDIQVSIILPTFNEELAICGVLDEISQVMASTDIAYELIVVDDGSTDKTRSLCECRSDVRLLYHNKNLGTGAARTTGVKAAKGRVIAMIDADGTYPVAALPDLLARLEHCDMVIGAREREMGTLRLLRSAAKEFIRLLASYLTRTRIPDLNSGMRAMKRDLVLEFLAILPSTHSWVSTITMAFLSSGYTVEWMPISYHRRIGRSTFHPITDTYNYLSLVVRSIMYFNPLRVFLPLSLGTFLLGVGKMIYDIFAYNFHLAPTTVTLLLTSMQIGALGLLADLIVRRSRL